jgi:hypothetical protein
VRVPPGRRRSSRSRYSRLIALTTRAVTQGAAAARVKPGGETGVRIDDYADKLIMLTTVTRNER